MKREDIEICILRVSGTGCYAETERALRDLGVRANAVHANKIIKDRSLLEYDALVFPGGFSYGGHIRAGAIWGKRLIAKLGDNLKKFMEDGRPVLGISNGFQVLVEAGLLPGFEGSSERPEAALAPNTSMKYECRWVYLKHENSGTCAFTKRVPKGKKVLIPVAHAEGRFIFSKENEEDYLRRLYRNDQLVFRYCDEKGEYADGKYPTNPNGALHDIAGICNAQGNVFGLMPHPERAFYGWQLPNWTREARIPRYGDGKLIFESMIEYLMAK